MLEEYYGCKRSTNNTVDIFRYCDNIQTKKPFPDVQYLICNKGYNTFWSTPFLFAAYELSGTGASREVGGVMGRFEFVPGVEKEGSPVYRQAHSKELATDMYMGDILLYRWESPLILLSYPPHTRSGDEWLVVLEEHNMTLLKAKAGEDPTLPPSVGWQFSTGKDKFEEDPSVRCRALPAGSPPCSVTLKLSGLAKDFQGKCEGEYKDIGLRSFGRQVTFRSIKSFAHFKQLIGVQTGGLP